jgi:nicotinamidase/pyrazinamidase
VSIKRLLNLHKYVKKVSNMLSLDSVLIVVDAQNGFMPGGGLPVPRGDEVVPVINQLGSKFSNIVLTQDWHPAGHASFASSHAGKAPYDMMNMPYGPQVLWPDHCVQGTHDAALHKDLHLPHAQLIIRKGFHPQVDSYSAFMEADRSTTTGLAAYLQARGLRKVYVCGLATDFCIAWTALDARAAGFEAVVIEDACRAIDLNGSLATAWQQMLAAGVQRMQSHQLN